MNHSDHNNKQPNVMSKNDNSENTQLEGRNAVLEAFRAGMQIEHLYVQDSSQGEQIRRIIQQAKKAGCVYDFVPKERLNSMSVTGRHQGVIAKTAACEYASVEEILQKAEDAGEAPFIFILDEIEDPHNLGAMIRTANLAGAHGVIIPKRRAAGLTAAAVRASAGAVGYTPVARTTNLVQTMKDLKKQGLWFVCADMEGESMYGLDLTGPIGLVIGNEGSGVSRLVRENCDFTASIPMKGDIDSLNASVAAGILAFEIAHQREVKQH